VLNSVKPTASDPAPPPTPDPSREHHPIDAWAWQRRLSALSGWVGRELGRPRTRLAVIGVVVLVVAALGIVSSVWTLPLVIAGVAMVLVAWIGARLDGRFAVEWGEAGTQLEFRAQIKAPAAVRPAIAPSAVGGPAVRVPTLAQLDDPDVIEGEGHTVEIDVAELKALIASAEAREARGATSTSGESAPGVDGAHADRPAA
jgi:hypothetical protein